jgi:hypothetical protein
VLGTGVQRGDVLLLVGFEPPARAAIVNLNAVIGRLRIHPVGPGFVDSRFQVRALRNRDGHAVRPRTWLYQWIKPVSEPHQNQEEEERTAPLADVTWGRRCGWGLHNRNFSLKLALVLLVALFRYSFKVVAASRSFLPLTPVTVHALACAAVVERLAQTGIRHEVHAFPSGALLLDVWCRDRFYVLHFEEGMLGISEITAENPGFSTRPDERVKDLDILLAKVELLLVA